MSADIDTVRRYTGDRASQQREDFQANTSQTEYNLSHAGILSSPAPRVWVDTVLKTETIDYTVNYSTGRITFLSAPTVGANITVEYTASAFTDADITLFLADAGGNTTLASALLLWAWAAVAAQSAMKETRSGGSGFGLVTVDTSVRARELRLSAQALYDRYTLVAGNAVPADSWTEIAWTEQAIDTYQRVVLLRNIGGIAV